MWEDLRTALNALALPLPQALELLLQAVQLVIRAAL
jgi:hypothetical protein